MPGPLETIVQKGNRNGIHCSASGWLLCEDGFNISVAAGFGMYCLPRPSGVGPLDDTEGEEVASSGPYTHLECGFPSGRPEPWEGETGWSWFAEEEDEPLGTVYAYVPVAKVAALLASHGGVIKAFMDRQEMLLAFADRKIRRVKK